MRQGNVQARTGSRCGGVWGCALRRPSCAFRRRELFFGLFESESFVWFWERVLVVAVGEGGLGGFWNMRKKKTKNKGYFFLKRGWISRAIGGFVLVWQKEWNGGRGSVHRLGFMYLSFQVEYGPDEFWTEENKKYIQQVKLERIEQPPSSKGIVNDFLLINLTEFLEFKITLKSGN